MKNLLNKLKKLDTRVLFTARLAIVGLVIIGSSSLFEAMAPETKALKACFSKAGLDYKNRVNEAAKLGIWKYKGTAEEKKVFTTVLCEGEDLGFAVATDYQKSLSAPMTSSQDFVPVTSLLLRDNTVLTMADLGNTVFLTLEPGASKEEIVMCTGIDTTLKRFTGCTRGLAFKGTSTAAVTANQQTHSSGATVVMSNVHYVYQQFLELDGTAQTVTTTVTFINNPRASSTTAVPTSNADYVTAYYANTIVAGGFSNLNIDTARGLSETGGAPVKVGINLSPSSTGPLLFDSNGALGFYVTGTTGYAVSATRAVVASSSGLIYPTNSNFTSSTFKFIGFAATDAVTSTTVYITPPGSILCKFTGLTAGSNYYLNGANGQISTTEPASTFTYSARVGLALSSTCLQVLPPKYVMSGTIDLTSSSTPGTVTVNFGFYPKVIDVIAAGNASTTAKNIISVGRYTSGGNNNHFTIWSNSSSTGALDNFELSNDYMLRRNDTCGAGATTMCSAGQFAANANGFVLNPTIQTVPGALKWTAYSE